MPHIVADESLLTTALPTRKAYPSDATRSLRRRLRRQRARDEARERGARAQGLLDFAGRVRALSSDAPDAETRVRLGKLAYRLELNALTSPSDRERLIVLTLGKWAALTLTELADETSLSRADVGRALVSLQSGKRVVSFTRGERRDAGRNGAVKAYRLLTVAPLDS
jgi:hypothetical protein